MNEKKNGYFGELGGMYVPETLVPALEELEQARLSIQRDPSFWDELNAYLCDYAGRPTPLTFAKNLSDELACKIYLKREDLCHTGAHKINNVLGQALLAKRMGKTRVIAETGAGQHGVATATACALLGLKCDIFMGAEDVLRQAANVKRMEVLGAQLKTVSLGSKTLKDAMNEALRDWVCNIRNTYYLIGSVAGPHPYPTLVRDFQKVIGIEAKEQILKKEGRLPDLLVACVGGGSNAMGLFYDFIDDKRVEMMGVEAAGEGIETKRHAASLTLGKIGVLHGSKTYLLQNEDGQIDIAHSISAGLDYPGVGPEIAWLKENGRMKVSAISDEEALSGFERLAKSEGIIPALETSHALGYLLKNAKDLRGKIVLVNLSGRGDKDLSTYMKARGQ